MALWLVVGIVISLVIGTDNLSGKQPEAIHGTTETGFPKAWLVSPNILTR
jgi:hypothetical protein